jgi:hypothetical protein
MSLQLKRPVQRANTSRLVGYPPDGPVTPSPVVSIAVFPILPEYKSAQDILDEIEKQKKDKRNEADRLKRKENREQKARIKKALRTPVSELGRIVKEIREKEKEQREQKAVSRESQGNDGYCMMNAPREVARLVTTPNIEFVGAARMRAQALGSLDMDAETGEAFWPESDRRYVKPDGEGQKPGGLKSLDVSSKKHFNPLLDKGIPQSVNRFKVDPYTNHEQKLKWGQALQDLFHVLFLVVPPDAEYVDGYFICRLCETKHDPRFGNVVEKWI